MKKAAYILLQLSTAALLAAAWLFMMFWMISSFAP